MILLQEGSTLHQDIKILHMLVLKDDTLLTEIHLQKTPDPSSLLRHQEEIKTILFTKGPTRFVKFFLDGSVDLDFLFLLDLDLLEDRWSLVIGDL